MFEENGIILSDARYINADSTGVNLPLGLGARHMVAAAITLVTRSVAVVVSESSMVRIFHQGKMVAEIIPEIWMLGRESISIEGPYVKRKTAGFRIVASESRDQADESNPDSSCKSPRSFSK